AGPPAASWTRRLGADAGLAHALVCAAVRETFEEAGVLLAGRSTAAVADPTGGTWPADRAALERHELSLAQLLARRRLVLRADLLAPWSHWITPAAEPRRYDTRFFVAALPAGQRTADSTGEADDVAWRRPLDALAEAAAGTRRMFPPTVVSLREIAPYADVGAVLRAAAERPVETITPTVRHRQVVLPDGTSFAAPGP
ncbi:MAG: NUDIX hydrolase, partial [Mycobacteriales bacterium]